METFQEVAESQKQVDDQDASAAAVLVEKLTVEDKAADAEKKDEEKSEEKTGEKESASEASKADADKKVEEPASSAWEFFIHILYYYAIRQGCGRCFYSPCLWILSYLNSRQIVIVVQLSCLCLVFLSTQQAKLELGVNWDLNWLSFWGLGVNFILHMYFLQVMSHVDWEGAVEDGQSAGFGYSLFEFHILVNIHFWSFILFF